MRHERHPHFRTRLRSPATIGEVEDIEVRGQTRVVGMAGSLRRGSYNRRLLESAVRLAPDGVAIHVFNLSSVPLYNGDVEAAGDPPGVGRLKRAIREADAVLIVTPEYNRSIPAVTKNAIDWASRPPSDPPLGGKPVALAGASPGRSGAAGALAHARVALEGAGAIVLPATLSIPFVTRAFDADGELSDPETRADLERFLASLRAAVRRPAPIAAA